MATDPITPERRRFSIRLPHWRWFLFATVILVVAGIGLSFWLPHHREQDAAHLIDGRKGHVLGGDDRRGQSPTDRPVPLTAPLDEGNVKAAQRAFANSLGKSSPIEKNSIGMELVLIPPGECTMGSPESEPGRIGDRETQIDVTLTKSFYLAKTEVTQRQWQAVMGTTPWKGQLFVAEGGNYAATYLSWDDAKEFCKTLSERENTTYRLPTEAEWEYACRGCTSTRFSFGDHESQLGQYAWYNKNTQDLGKEFAQDVGRKQANPFGLHDVHGNVWEWCEDVYTEKLPGGPIRWFPRETRVGCGGAEAGGMVRPDAGRRTATTATRACGISWLVSAWPEFRTAGSKAEAPDWTPELPELTIDK